MVSNVHGQLPGLRDNGLDTCTTTMPHWHLHNCKCEYQQRRD